MKSKAELRGILSSYSCCNCIATDVFGTIMITTFSNKKNAENCKKHHRSRNGRSQMFFKIGVLKNFSIFTGKHLCWSLLLNKWQTFKSAALLKETPTQLFSCEYCEIFKNTFFIEQLRWLLLIVA